MLPDVHVLDQASGQRIEHPVVAVSSPRLLHGPGRQHDVSCDSRAIDGPLADPDVATRIDIADHVVLHVRLVPVDDSAGVGLVDDVLRDRGLALEVVDADGAGDARIEDVVDVVAPDDVVLSGAGDVDGGPVYEDLVGAGDVVVFDDVVPRADTA